MTRGRGDTGKRRCGGRVQGFDVGRFEDFAVLALADQKGAVRTREISGNEVRPEDVILFLKDAWREGFGGGKPGVLMVDGGAVNYHELVLRFLHQNDVILRQITTADQARQKWWPERVFQKLRRAGTPAPPIS